jgi:DNA-binding MurR/RpiR family transcriptional regulator
VTYAGGDVYERATALSHLARKEVIIGMTPVEGPSGVAKVLRYARQQGALTLACTPSLSRQAARAAEHLLYAPGESEGTLLRLTGLYAICMAMAQAITLLQPEAAVKRTAAITRALEDLA